MIKKLHIQIASSEYRITQRPQDQPKTHLISPPDILHQCKPNLRKNRTKLPTRSADPVRCGPIPRRERLPGDHKCRRVRSKVLEKIGEAVEEDKGVLAVAVDLVIPKALWDMRQWQVSG